MKLTWPPLQCDRVGFESNQQGHAALQEHASSMTPETFQEVFLSSPARAIALLNRTRVASASFVVRMMSSSVGVTILRSRPAVPLTRLAPQVAVGGNV